MTLEVTPRIGEKIAVAQTLGGLSLALRSIADNQSELERAIASGDVKLPAGATKEQEEALLNQAMKRPMEGATSFVTGGDVSRFQRRTVPLTKEAAVKEFMRSAGASAGKAIVDRTGPSGPSPRAGEGYRSGPVVRVTRGKSTTEVPVGGN